MLGVPYNSQEAAALGRRIMAFIQEEAAKASVDLAKERGAFANYPGSVFADETHHWYNGGVPRRNATVTTVAPTGTISIIAACSSGIEPLFALAFHRKVLDGATLVDAHPYFEEVARARGFFSESLMREIALRGTVQELEDVPEDVRRVFVTAHDISPLWHLEHQAAFQRHTENAVSKTVNFPNNATRDDVAEVYRLAYLKGCKGTTIYRDGSRDVQVLNVGTGAKKEEAPKGEAADQKPGNGNGHSAPGNGGGAARPVQPKPKFSGLTLSAGGAKVAISAGGVTTGSSNSTEPLVKRFSVEGEGAARLERAANAKNLYIQTDDGVRIPLTLVAQQGNVARGLQLVIEPVSASGTSVVATRATPKCPECGSSVEMVEGCRVCRSCGYSKCG
jgi:ribonucleoside-diphosphate reductase alpha chain